MSDSALGIRFFNTLTREKERFVPLEPGKAGMYTCGPTVYDYAHIGNFRTFLFEDLLRRWLEFRGFRVLQVMNLTDVDDRTISAAKKQGIPLAEHTKQFIDAFFDDLKSLNVERAEHYPRATEHVPEMVALIKKLLDKGFAYRAEDGSIYFDISKWKDYGKLSKFKVDELKAGARVKADDYEKAEAEDFALWKAWTEEDGPVSWDTEIGRGRPGWHIECSAMSMKYLGETFDIHTGGVDNMFPHHENEIAQSEAATGKKFVNYWLHCEHLLVEGKRMAKRFGNYYTLRDLLGKGYDPMAVRYLLISTHYRQQFNFTFEGLAAAKSAVERLTNFVRRLSEVSGSGSGEEAKQLVMKVRKDFEEAMDDDLNIGQALAALFEFVRDVNNLIDSGKLGKSEAEEVRGLMVTFDKVLGVIGEVKAEVSLPRETQELISAREEARKAKDWKRADEIRVQLRQMGIVVEDTAQGVRWHVEKKAG
jgi:cysteinyl-tRNA synthetase